jgi:DNA-binding SARP family transcriptional activator
MSVEFRVLGPLEAWDDGRRLELGGRRQRAVLTALLLRSGEVVSVSRLIDDVWGERVPATASNVLQGYVSELRKTLGRETIVTHGRGYRLNVDQDAVDLRRFERLVADAGETDAARAAGLLREALALWRGTPLSDLADMPFVDAAAARLQELRLAAIERRVEVELALGRHAELVGDLVQLVAEQPLRERVHGLLMLALYRSGRQADALAAYQEARRSLVEGLGIEPGPALRDLESAILRQDPGLEGVVQSSPAQESPDQRPARRAILVVPSEDAGILSLVAIAEPLARRPPRELIIARLLPVYTDPGPTTARLGALRQELVSRGRAVRVVAYTSPEPAADAVLFAEEQEVDFLLVDAAPSLLDTGLPDAALDTVLRQAPCDVGILAHGGAVERGRPVIVPFGGDMHDWAAVEIAAWVARALDSSLRLAGRSTDRFRRRDASRLLGRASLLIQSVVGIVAEPVLVGTRLDELVEVAADASLLVAGLSSRWREEGLGAARLELVRASGVPTLLVRGGLRPGGLAPAHSMTRFTWSIAAPEM